MLFHTVTILTEERKGATQRVWSSLDAWRWRGGEWESGNVSWRRNRCGIYASGGGGEHVIGARLMGDGIRHFVWLIIGGMNMNSSPVHTHHILSTLLISCSITTFDPLFLFVFSIALNNQQCVILLIHSVHILHIIFNCLSIKLLKHPYKIKSTTNLYF